METIIDLHQFSAHRQEGIPLLFGRGDCNLKMIKDALKIKIVARDNMLKIYGEEEGVNRAKEVFGDIIEYIMNSPKIRAKDIEWFIERLGIKKEDTHQTKFFVQPRTPGQRRYLEAIRDHDITFSIGPAGTGKTYLAVAMAVGALKTGEISRIVLVRPAVEAGEKLGFLPGDFQAKINPYLRPLYDALYDLLEFSQMKKYMERDIIEIAPLAYMRGRTLEGAFIILDEAQNTTGGQMKMFLTRLGMRSKAVITGDITQIDLLKGETSGLIQAQKILKNIDGMAFVKLTKEDIVRHPLVQKIVDAYDKYEQMEK